MRVSIDEAVRDRIVTLVSQYLDQPLSADLCTEPVAIRSGTAVVYLRLVDATPAVVRIFSPLLRRVDRTPELLGELNDLNARLSFLRMFWRDGTVYLVSELLAHTLTDAELANVCDTVADAADYYDEWLNARFGGQTAYAERRLSR